MTIAWDVELDYPKFRVSNVEAVATFIVTEQRKSEIETFFQMHCWKYQVGGLHQSGKLLLQASAAL